MFGVQIAKGMSHWVHIILRCKFFMGTNDVQLSWMQMAQAMCRKIFIIRATVDLKLRKTRWAQPNSWEISCSTTFLTCRGWTKSFASWPCFWLAVLWLLLAGLHRFLPSKIWFGQLACFRRSTQRTRSTKTDRLQHDYHHGIVSGLTPNQWYPIIGKKLLRLYKWCP